MQNETSQTHGTEDGLEFGLTGPDWLPDASTRYYAQMGKAYAFGPTEALAVAALKDLLTETTSNAK